MKKYEYIENNCQASLRYRVVLDALEKIPSDIDPSKYTKDILRRKYGFICSYDGVSFDTIWSTVIDLNESEMFIASGNPAKIHYLKDERMKMLCKINKN